MSVVAHDDILGRIYDNPKLTFLPGRTGPANHPTHLSVIRAVHRSGNRDYRYGQILDATFGFGSVPEAGLRQAWREHEDYQRQYRTPEAFVNSFRGRTLGAAIGHNERCNNGAAIVQKLVFASSGAPQPDHASNGPPTAMALGTTGMTAVTDTDLSINSATHFVTTNEYTGFGLTRTSPLTVTNVGMQGTAGTMDRQIQVTVTNTFTNTTQANTVNGGALFDSATVSICNMWLEYKFGTASTLQISDTLAVTGTLNM